MASTEFGVAEDPSNIEAVLFLGVWHHLIRFEQWEIHQKENVALPGLAGLTGEDDMLGLLNIQPPHPSFSLRGQQRYRS